MGPQVGPKTPINTSETLTSKEGSWEVPGRRLERSGEDLQPNEISGLVDLSVAYLEAMMARGRRPETLRAYSRDLAAFLGHVGDVKPDDVTSADMIAFLEQLSGEGKAGSSVVRARDVVRAFWSWLRSQGHAKTNPTEAIEADARWAEKRPRRREADVALEEIKAIVANLEVAEDRLVANLVAATGRPVSEVVGLETRQVLFVDDRHPEMPGGVAVLRMPGRRGGEQSVVVADPEVVSALERHVAGRDPSLPLCTVPMRTLQYRFRQAARDAGLPTVTLRDLRQVGASSEKIGPRS